MSILDDKRPCYRVVAGGIPPHVLEWFFNQFKCSMDLVVWKGDRPGDMPSTSKDAFLRRLLPKLDPTEVTFSWEKEEGDEWVACEDPTARVC